MTNEQIWNMASKQTLLNVAASLLLTSSKPNDTLFPDDMKDIIVKKTYNEIGEKLMSFSIPKIPKELK